MNRTSFLPCTGLLVLVALCNWQVGSAGAATLDVWPDGAGSYPDIQAAVQAAAYADTVLLHDGLFQGPNNHNISFAGKRILVCSESNRPELCVIDCQGNGGGSDQRGFVFEHGEGPGAVLRGVTVTNGSSVWVYGRQSGGNLLIADGASPTIENCVFQDAMAKYGGGVACYGGGPTFTDCVISGSTATYGGGGIWIDSHATPLFVNCRFLDNSGVDGGGAIWIDHYAAPVFQQCAFERNGADRGGALFMYWGNVSFSGCLFKDNEGWTEGGVVENWQYSVPDFVDCTFSGNNSHYGAVALARERMSFSRCTMYDNVGWSGVLMTTDHGKITVDHSIIAFSRSGCAAFCYGGDSITVACSDLYQNPGGDWRWCVTDDFNGLTNVSLDPQFCDPQAGDFHVQPESWCAPGMNPGCGQVGAWPPCQPSSVSAGGLAPAGPWLRAIPNPALGACRLEWILPAAQQGLSLAIFDVNGRQVRSFRHLAAGLTTLDWNGRDDQGLPLPSGIYLARAGSGKSMISTRIVLRR